MLSAVLLQSVGTEPGLSTASRAVDPTIENVPARVWEVVGAILVLVLGWYVSKLVVRSVGRAIARQFQRPSITQTVLGGIRAGVIVVFVFIAARILQLDTGDVLLSGAVFGAVLGVILAPIVASVISGLFVLADQPFEIGDMIELVDEGQKGFVDDITLRYTKMFTLDNTFIVIPNSTIRDRDVINYSAEDERTRRSLELLVTYESDVEAARTLAERSARRVEDVISGGPDIRIGKTRFPAAPTCFIEEYADNGVLLMLRYWVEEPYKLQAIESEVKTNIWNDLDDADVEIAYPHTHLVFDETSGEAQVAVSQGDHSPAVTEGSEIAPGEPSVENDGAQ
ncbi:mechanosensitive ion channel family protein [Natranaeroarchaeum aerophilus]|uniref:Mechanosensitive ion channel family protein n=1 Tax=Natranaeroarchaeum aerophilus TaxID=2917711 RepID=A0AAE3FRY6_9EURY|nr:mechanosensitive ion channel family protein [Natranaeroarchaeum aerophilus]MCL9813798.1 mechanosensitive ion channel family protein [Natranaeroarchaeum aerophilus]